MLDALITGLKEDCPYSDITTELLAICGQGKFRFISREAGIVSGTVRLKRFFESQKLTVKACMAPGSAVEKGEVLVEAQGELVTLFKLWRVCQTYLTVMSAIATQTHKIVSAAREINPDIQIVVACRKAHLGMRQDEISAIQDGGAIYHRNSLSDTILITQNHMRMLGELPEKLYSMQHKIEFEPSNLEEAYRYARHVDVMLLDHFEPQTLKTVVQELRQRNPQLQIGVAGGITLDTVKEFAEAVDIVVLSSVLYAYPLDITCRIERI